MEVESFIVSQQLFTCNKRLSNLLIIQHDAGSKTILWIVSCLIANQTWCFRTTNFVSCRWNKFMDKIQKSSKQSSFIMREFCSQTLTIWLQNSPITNLLCPSSTEKRSKLRSLAMDKNNNRKQNVLPSPSILIFVMLYVSIISIFMTFPCRDF